MKIMDIGQFSILGNSLEHRNYITLFDRNYEELGLAMINSLCRNTTKPVRVFIVCIDDINKSAIANLYKHSIHHIIFLDLDYIDHLTRGKITLMLKNRDYREFCWSLASFCTDFIAEYFALKEITYLDSDVFFTSDPEYIFEKMGNKKVAVVPHMFPAHDYDRLIPNGKYNVSWVTFREDRFDILKRWQEQVFRKCNSDTCGDQKYLDEWPMILGEDLYEMDKGMGSGPWNAYTYDFRKMLDFITVDAKPLIFYHFHEFRKKNGNNTSWADVNYTYYPTNPQQIEFIYKPYHIEVMANEAFLKGI